MKGNILVLTNNIGGLHSFRKEVMKAIVDEGYEVYISEPDDDERVKYFEEIGCHIIKTDLDRRGMNPLADFKLMVRYVQIIWQIKPTAVLSYTTKPNIYGGIASRLTSTPLIANITGFGDAIENGGWLHMLTTFLYKCGLRNAYQVFFQNEDNKLYGIKKGIAEERSIVLPGSGVNLLYHKYQEYPSDGIIKFLFIARLLKDKGTSEYFEMAKMIKDRYPRTEFQVLGPIEGNYHKQLEELVKEGVINYLGTTSDVRSFIGEVHCTVMPSYHEGMSNVNLESAANGRPVITTNVPGCRETADDGITGFLVEAKNTNSLTDAVERFINLSYEEKVSMGLEARHKVEREFDRNYVVREYLKVISSLL